MAKGLFVSLEGIEGGGKSTQREYVKEFFVSKGYTVRLTREPGGTPAAEQLREFLLTPRDEPIPNTAEVLAFFAARAIHVENVIKPAVERGEVIICDRFVDSTYAYQVAEKKLTFADIEPIEWFTLGDFKADLVIILDIDTETSKQRLMRRGGRLDRFELKGQAFFARARAAFLERSKLDPSRYAVVDATQSIEQVSLEIDRQLERLLSSLKEGNDHDAATARALRADLSTLPRGRHTS